MPVTTSRLPNAVNGRGHPILICDVHANTIEDNPRKQRHLNDAFSVLSPSTIHDLNKLAKIRVASAQNRRQPAFQQQNSPATPAPKTERTEPGIVAQRFHRGAIPPANNPRTSAE